MYKLVVFSALLAVAAASGIGHGIAYGAPLAYASAPLVHPLVKTYAAAPVVHTVAHAPVVQTYTAPAIAVGHEITKHVHYESKPVVTGYTSQILKPDLGSIATPLNLVTKQRVLAPARTVATITPQVTQVHPELHVRKVAVDVPVPAPYVSEVEVRHPAPIIAHAAPVAVEARVAHVATPVVAHHNLIHSGFAHNVVSTGVIGAPALSYAGLQSW